MPQEHLAEDRQGVLTVELAPDVDGQVLTVELVDYAEYAEGLPVMGAIHDEVVGPRQGLVHQSQPVRRQNPEKAV
jgi:hypothetical protein